MTTKTKHTPGPWEYACIGTDSIKIYQEMNLGRDIAEINDGYDKEDEANARLIAASPDLLSACKGAIERVDKAVLMLIALGANKKHAEDYFSSTRFELSQAIAKAEGRGK